MITRLQVQNFKCLRDVTVDLGPFTVLIGSNDSGKSSLLDAIQILGRTVSEPLPASLALEGTEPANVFEELVWQRDATRQIRLSIQATSGEATFDYDLSLRTGPAVEAETLSITKNKAGRAKGTISLESRLDIGRSDVTSFNWTVGQKFPTIQTLLPLIPGFASSAKYRFEPRALRRVAPLESKPTLTSTGDNLPEALDAIFTGPDRSAIQRLESALHEAVPTLSGIALRTVRPKGSSTIGKALEFTLAGTSPPVTVPATHASEGALLLTAFLTLAYGDTPEVLLIEEPENGLHPTRLAIVIELLRKISTGAIGNRPRQVIMTTHSPLLLNYILPEEVRIVRRDPERGTEVTPMTAVPNLERMLGEFAVGELWYLLTEEGLLRGDQP